MAVFFFFLGVIITVVSVWRLGSWAQLGGPFQASGLSVMVLVWKVIVMFESFLLASIWGVSFLGSIL